MTEFTPLTSLIGGILIGFSALLIMATNGKIAGISGLLGSILFPKGQKNNAIEALFFVIGLLVAIPLYQIMTGTNLLQSMSSNYSLLGSAGILVGFGALLGAGCTSGHGVCGISRLSPRSIVATLTFMTTGAIAVFILRHMIGA